ncbi:MAG: hypothetical protein ACRDPA_23940, partial [Solirubrobacteraceae bacterium]
RGVDRELVDDALGDQPESDSERDRAVALVRRRFPSPPRDRRERERAFGMLLRRGYDSDLALEAIAAVAAHQGASDGWDIDEL